MRTIKFNAKPSLWKFKFINKKTQEEFLPEVVKKIDHQSDLIKVLLSWILTIIVIFTYKKNPDSLIIGFVISSILSFGSFHIIDLFFKYIELRKYK